MAKVVNRGGRWTVHAVVKDSPAYEAGVRAGTILVSLEGKRAKDLAFEALSAVDEGPLGSSLSAEILDREDSFRSLSVERAELPEVGTMEVLRRRSRWVPTNAGRTGSLDATAARSVGPRAVPRRRR